MRPTTWKNGAGPIAVLRIGDQVLVVGGLGDREGLDEALIDRDQRRTRIVQHHVDRRVGERRLYLGDLVDRQHRIERDLGVVVGLAERRHQHVLVRLLPAAGEGREHQAPRLGQRLMPGKGVHGAERKCARHEAAPGEVHHG